MQVTLGENIDSYLIESTIFLFFKKFQIVEIQDVGIKLQFVGQTSGKVVFICDVTYSFNISKFKD